MAKNLIIGTAGHIDHGKTTLIKALTGQDTDRLVEEKRRGISIELGFGCLKLNNDLQIGIIDVPGHEKFIKKMLAGAGGVDMTLLLVAANEGVMPQTKEHFAILNLLNVEYGIVVVTKCDLVEEEWLELVIEEIKDEFKETFLENSPIVPISAIEGKGLDRLKKEIEKMISKIPLKDEGGNVYFPIDRVFSIIGQGTVITGTLIEGKIKQGDKLKVYPAGIDVKVRSLQVHEKDVTLALPGQRVGINLARIDTAEIARGDVLATPESLVKTRYLDARFKLLDSSVMILKHGDRIRLHLGAKEVLGRIFLLDKKEIYPGEEGLVQFNLEEDVIANFKERYVLRRYSPMTTIGGGEILDPNPQRHKKFDNQVIKVLTVKDEGSLEQRVELTLELVTTRPLKVEELIKDTSLSFSQLAEILEQLKEVGKVVDFKTGKSSTWLHISHYQHLKEEIIKCLQDFHQKHHLKLGMIKEELRTKLSLELDVNEYNLLLADLVAEGKIILNGVKISLAEFSLKFTPEETVIKKNILEKYGENSFSPPALDKALDEFKDKELALKVVESLLGTKDLIEVSEGVCFSFETLGEAKKLLVKYLKEKGEIELGEYRDLLNSSRKYTLALLNYFDKEGITKRKGNKRVLK